MQLAQQSADAGDFKAADKHLQEASAVQPEAANLALAKTDIDARRSAAERTERESEAKDLKALLD